MRLDHSNERLREALRLMSGALKLLDEEGAPSEIGAHLDLAIHRLEGLLKSTRH